MPGPQLGQARVQLAGRGLAIALNLASFGVMLDALGAGGFGEMTLGLTVAYIVSVFTGLGLDVALFRRLSADANANSFLANTLAARIAVCTAATVVTVLVAVALPLAPGVTACIAVASLSVFFGPLSTLQQILRSRVRLLPFAIGDVAGSVLTLALLLALASSGHLYAATAVACTVAANAIVASGLALLGLRQLVPDLAAITKRAIVGLIRDARHLAIGDFLVVAYYRADVLVLGALAGTAATGVYGATYRLVDIAMYVQAIFIGAAFPALVRASREPELLRAAIAPLLEHLVLLGSGLFCVALVVGPDLLIWVGGSTFDGIGPVLFLLMLAVIVMFANRVLVQSLIAAGRGRAQIASWLGGFVGVAICAITAPTFGAQGAAASVLVGEILIFAIAAHLLHSHGALDRTSLRLGHALSLVSVLVTTLAWVIAPEAWMAAVVGVGLGLSLLLVSQRPAASAGQSPALGIRS